VACYHPLDAYRSRMPKDNGSYDIVFNSAAARDHESIKLPCGQCVGCRLERSRQWAIRCMHEADMHEDNCFITLTFNNESLYQRKNPHSVDVRDFQLFMKRLRKRFGDGIRFYHCGEYGEKYLRPHYHACLFNFDFDDKKLWKITETGCRLYTSVALEELWPYGFSTIGDVTFESAAYVARYIMKKVNGDAAVEHYRVVDQDTGEVLVARKPEYTTMSRRPGIGKDWFDKYIDDVYPGDYVIVRGIKCKPPKYYDGILKTQRPYEFDEVKYNRLIEGEKHVTNNTPERLAVREEVAKARVNKLIRTLD
jgi:hypothetical protein